MVVCGSKRGHRGKIGETRQKWMRWMELLLPGAECPGQWTDVRDVGFPVDTGGCPGSWIGDEHEERHVKNCNSGAKFGRIGGWKSWERWGKARSTRCKADPWIKSNKTSSHQQITKKIGGYFWWRFSDLGRKQQNQARKHGVGAPKM